MSIDPRLLERAYEHVCRDWTFHPTYGGPPVPPSLELFAEAVARANRSRFMAPEAVAISVIAGRWPEAE